MHNLKQLTLFLGLWLFVFLLVACGPPSGSSSDNKVHGEANGSSIPVSENGTNDKDTDTAGDTDDEEKPQSAMEIMFQQPVLVQDQNDLYGYIGADGEYIIPAAFRYAEPFSEEGLALVRDADKDLIGYIDVNGNYVVEPQYLEAYSYKNGFAAVATNLDRGRSIYTNWGYLDETGTPITAFIFDDALDFSGGLAAVCLNERYGYIDTTGEMVIPPTFEGVTSFLGGRAFVNMAWDGNCAMIREDGSLLTGFDYHLSVQNLYAGNRSAKVYQDAEGYFRVRKTDPSSYSLQTVYLDAEGNEISGTGYAGSLGDPAALGVLAVSYFDENGLARAMAADNLWGIIRADGSWQLPPQFLNMVTLDWVQDAASGLYGKIDLDGTWVVAPTYDTLRYEPGILFATKDGTNYVLDTSGTVLVKTAELGSNTLERLGSGVLCTRDPNTEEYHLVDEDGYIYGEVFSSYQTFCGNKDDGCFVAGYDGLFGIMDTTGSWKIPPKFKRLRP